MDWEGLRQESESNLQQDNLKGSYSLFISIVLIIIIVTIIGVVWINGNTSELYIREGWHYRWGDSPKAADGQPEWVKKFNEPEEWHNTRFPGQPPGWDGKSVLWLHGILPTTVYAKPILFLATVNHHIECWVDGRRIYQSGEIPVPEGTAYNPWFPMHLIELPNDAAGKNIYLRIHSNGPIIGLGAMPRIGDHTEIVAIRTRLDFFRTGSVFLGLFGSSIAFFMALRNKGLKSYYAFAGGAVCNSLVGMSGIFNIQTLIKSSQILMFGTMTGALFGQGFLIWFLESIVQERHVKTVRRIRYLLFLVAASGMLLLCFDTGKSIFLVRMALCMLVLNIILLFHVFWGQLRTNEEARIYAAGIGAWAVALGADALRSLGILALPVAIGVSGQLVDLSCQAFILLQRVRRLYQQKEEAALQILRNNDELNLLNAQINNSNDNLERQITQRTGELQATTLLLQQQNEKLACMEKARQHLVSNIAHDLRTPVMMIRGYVEAILDGVAQEPVQKEKALQVIHSKTLLLNNLIEDFFTLCKLESRMLTVEWQKALVGNFLKSILDSYQADAANLNVKLLFLVPPEVRDKIIKIDRFRLEQVFANLIYNAVKYTPAGGSITVAAGVGITGDEVVFSVRDTGVGISVEELEKIFDRFYAGRGAIVHSVGSSTGLGLAIAKEIVDIHGGRIWVESEVGQGSIFYIALPLLQE
ncbi:sensor histidine kinase [Pelosinus propionicus]|uniref:sensor histidine kinase n=1 Tax=Pelosinus propionicus TaxID=380084 RepID=UPI001113F16A|nr:sensor histidine kinase [Pelosinus propionicus]